MSLTSRLLSSAAAVLVGTLLTASPADAQSLRDYPTTPELSLAASVMQTVGLTDMTVTYSSPAARERVIWGELVPYGEVWRAGANAPTKLTVSTDVMIGGTTVPAGSYTLVILPSDGNWTVILNTDPSGRGAYAYDAANDVARIDVTPTEAPHRERMTFLFEDTTNTRTHLVLDWAGMSAAIPVEVDTQAIVDANTEAAFESLWRPHYNVARYMLENGGDLDEAQRIMLQSIAVNSNWWNHWFLAKIQHELGLHRDARASVETAMALGEGDETFTNFFLPQAQEALADWPTR